jgi:hypothetical protein
VVRVSSVRAGPAVDHEPATAGGLVNGIVFIIEVARVLSSKSVDFHEWIEPGEKKAPVAAVSGVDPDIVRVVRSDRPNTQPNKPRCFSGKERRSLCPLEITAELQVGDCSSHTL